MTLRSPLLCALVALGMAQSFEAHALGLGNARGPVFIGRPLQITIAATLESGDPETPCVDADVFQGDARVDARRVTTQWDPAPDGRGVVRVSANATIEEPVVTIYLRVGCANKVTRRYVLLAEQPVEPESAVRPGVATVAPRGRQAPGEPSAMPSRPAAAVLPAPRAAAATRSEARRPPAAARAPARPAAQSPQARLRLEPLDLGDEREPPLKTSSTLQARPAADAPGRKQAAAMWQALSTSPEEALRSSERLQALERDVRTLHELARSNTLAVELMREQLQKARAERNALALVALLLLLAAVGTALAWRWRWQRAGTMAGSWWRGRTAASDSEFPSHLYADEPQDADRPTRATGLHAPDIDLSLPTAGDTAASQARRPPPALPPRFTASRWPQSDFGSQPGGPRLTAEELIDIQQQAEFFVSIDQPERAIAVLETHLEQQADTSALPWMDLMKIYHDLGRRQDYERVRQAFAQRFSAQVPEFDAFDKHRGGLEIYSSALSRIVSAWPSRRVLDVIEETLLRQPDAASGEAFDLEAYRELVLLYNIAKDVTDEGDASADSGPFWHGSDFSDTDLEKLTARSRAAANSKSVGSTQMPGPGDVGLDIDLGDLGNLGEPPPRRVRPEDGVSSQSQPLGGGQAPGPTPAPSSAPLSDFDSLDWRALR